MRRCVNFVMTVLCFTFSGCGGNFGNNRSIDAEYKNDISPVEKILKIAGIKHARWRHEKTSKDSFFSAPGPSTFRVWGYVEVNDDFADKLLAKFKWVPVSEGPLLPVRVEIENADDEVWMKSKGYEKSLNPDVWPKMIFFCPETGFIYFDISYGG